MFDHSEIAFDLVSFCKSFCVNWGCWYVTICMCVRYKYSSVIVAWGWTSQTVRPQVIKPLFLILKGDNLKILPFTAGLTKIQDHSNTTVGIHL